MTSHLFDRAVPTRPTPETLTGGPRPRARSRRLLRSRCCTLGGGAAQSPVRGLVSVAGASSRTLRASRPTVTSAGLASATARACRACPPCWYLFGGHARHRDGLCRTAAWVGHLLRVPPSPAFFCWTSNLFPPPLYSFCLSSSSPHPLHRLVSCQTAVLGGLGAYRPGGGRNRGREPHRRVLHCPPHPLSCRFRPWRPPAAAAAAAAPRPGIAFPHRRRSPPPRPALSPPPPPPPPHLSRSPPPRGRASGRRRGRWVGWWGRWWQRVGGGEAEPPRRRHAAQWRAWPAQWTVRSPPPPQWWPR